jgi:ubiquinone/menaquinone biosynthesis C-methylase UbiE
MTLTDLAHRIVSNPWAYDQAQRLLGYGRVQQLVRPHLQEMAGRTVLEVGAGTGNSVQMLPPRAAYIWSDNDPRKLAGYRQKYPAGGGMLCDATRLPLRDKCVDYALCVAVTHHLSDEHLPDLIAELARVTRLKLILWDPVEQRASRLSRLLWRYDRGSYPRQAQAVCGALEAGFSLEQVSYPVIYHHYILCVARPRLSA